MIKGTTKSGFNYTIQEGALDDYELLEELREIDKGNTSLIVDVIEKIIGSEQKEQLKKHVRDETGRVSIKRMVDEIKEKTDPKRYYRDYLAKKNEKSYRLKLGKSLRKNGNG